jgi:predicted secreted protein
MIVDERANGFTVQLRVGDDLELRLDENPTTAFRLNLDPRVPSDVDLGDTMMG